MKNKTKILKAYLRMPEIFKLQSFTIDYLKPQDFKKQGLVRVFLGLFLSKVLKILMIISYFYE